MSGAMHAYRENPSPEAALEVHASFLGFRMQQEAAEFRAQALEEFPESALLCAGLAAQLRQLGLFDEATSLFEKALQLRPDLPDARVGVAIIRMVTGELDQARELLGFLEEPGAGQMYNLGPLESLAHAYQRAGRHEEVLAICRHLLDEIPDAGQIHDFRKFVKTSHVDYPFEDPPSTLRVEGKNAVVTKTHLGRVQESPSLLLQVTTQMADMEAALR